MMVQYKANDTLQRSQTMVCLPKSHQLACGMCVKLIFILASAPPTTTHFQIYNKSKVSPAAPAASAPAPVASTPTPASPSPSPPPPSQAAEPQSVAKGDTTQEPGNDTDLNDEIIRELIAEHEEERAKWQEEKEQLEAERDRLIAANAQLQRERDEAIAAQEKALQDAIALQKEAANQLKEDNALSAIQEQLTKALQQIDDLKKERDDAFQQIDVLKNERDTALNDKEQLSRELQHLKAQTPQAAGDDEIQSLKNEIVRIIFYNKKMTYINSFNSPNYRRNSRIINLKLNQ